LHKRAESKVGKATGR